MAGRGKPAPKRKRVNHDLQFKYDAIMEVDKGERTKSVIATSLGIPSNTLSTWLGKRDYYIQAFESQSFGPKNKRMKTAQHPDIDSALDKFMRAARSQPEPISLSGPIHLATRTSRHPMAG